MPQLAEKLVGRAAELGALDEALAELERRNSRLLEIAGEPGIGKTRLLGELAARAAARRCVVLSGSAAELEEDLPFWVFVDALDEHVDELEPQARDALGPDVLLELARVFPALRAGAGDAPAPGERYRTHRAVRQLLEVLAAPRPLVLLLAELFLSPKTVETHIRNLFQKLGVSSRVEVARTVERADRRARDRAP